MKNFNVTLEINRSITGHEIQRLRDYAHVMERMVAAEADRESYTLEEAARYLKPLERADFFAENADYLQALTDGFIFQHRLSLISTIYAVFEVHLVHLCRMLCHQKSVAFTLRDLSGNSSLDKAKRLMERFFEVPLDAGIWQPMERFANLRNIASHQNGQLNEESLGLLPKIADAFPDALTHDNVSIRPTYGAAFALLDAVDAFYESLYRSLGTWAGVRSAAP